MERAKKVAALWAWLPTFRMVAETESVSEAARASGKSPSAVSRTISSIEQSLGRKLFLRRGRSLELNDAGKHLLSGTRHAMRLVDESLAAVKGRLVGSIKLVAQEPFSSLFLTPLFERLRAEHPTLVPTLTSLAAETVAPRLLDGSLDVAFVRQPPVRGPLLVSVVGTFPTAVYGALGHPATKRRGGDLRSLAHRFVEVEGVRGVALTPWPVDWPRTVSLYVPDYDMALSVCERLGLLAVLPCALVQAQRPSLVRLEQVGTAPVRIHAVRREPIDGVGAADLVVTLAMALAASSHTPAVPTRPV